LYIQFRREKSVDTFLEFKFPILDISFYEFDPWSQRFSPGLRGLRAA
jgi:hypothetical protein